MPRFFLNDPPMGDHITITGEDAKHIGFSLRSKVGDELTFCFDRTDHTAVIESFTKDSVTCRIISSAPSAGEPKTRLTLLCGLPKSDKAELIVQKCTELGAAGVIFFESARCIARFGSNAASKCERWRRVALEAAKQCGRGEIPQVSFCGSMEEAAELMSSADISLICYEKQGQRSVHLNELSQQLCSAENIMVMTGPEGGFEESEADLAISGGAVPIWLGSRILRCETAPLAVSAMILNICGEY